MNNTQVQTYAQMLNLVDKGYAISKISPCGRFELFKYHRRVMYDYKWDEPGIRECRGHVYHRDSGALVTLPPTKTFNHTEIYSARFDPKETVFAYEKHNGSMMAVSKFNDELIYTTTGSFDSDFVARGKRIIQHTFGDISDMEFWGRTLVFEILSKEDRHIVDEFDEDKAILLLSRVNNSLGKTSPAGKCIIDTYENIVKMAKESKGEGYMVYNANFNQCVKVKSDIYTFKKKLMRLNDREIEQMFSNPNRWAERTLIDNMYQDCVEGIVDTYTETHFMTMGEYDRRLAIEACFD